MMDSPDEQKENGDPDLVEEPLPPLRPTLFSTLHPLTILLLAASCLTLNQIIGGFLWKGQPGVSVLGLVVAPLVGIVLPFFLLLRRLGLSARRELGLHLLSPRQSLGTLICTTGLLPVVYALGWLNALLYEPLPEYYELFRSFAPEGPASFAAGFLAIVVAVPLGEELVFRRLVLGVFVRHMSTTLAVVLSGLVFGAAHLSPWIFLPISFLGCILGLLALRTGTLTAAWLGHAAFNFFSYVELALTSDPTSTRLEEASLYPPVLVAGLIVFAVGWRLVGRSRPEAENQEPRLEA